ncbi:MAG: SDR family NAD(P)-dependent oxidoreductase, partial [Rhizobiales bacterium]|nr:SDR family NAD(P)-dependent oxidoreductase [Hyphomicrobiales bacterium]
MTPTGNTILITGGASGIGLALAQAFLTLGNKVIIAGRRKALLDEVTAAHPGAVSYVLDIENKTDISELVRRVTQ